MILVLLIIFISFPQPYYTQAAQATDSAESQITIELRDGVTKESENSGDVQLNEKNPNGDSSTGKLPRTNDVENLTLAFVGTIIILFAFYGFYKLKKRRNSK